MKWNGTKWNSMENGKRMRQYKLNEKTNELGEQNRVNEWVE